MSKNELIILEVKHDGVDGLEQTLGLAFYWPRLPLFSGALPKFCISLISWALIGLQ